jgi:ubiquitin-protein ligase
MASSANLRRLKNEIKYLQQQQDHENMFTIKMVDDNTYHWDVCIFGPKDSLYEGAKFKLDVRLPNDYPFSPPHVKFITNIEHLNINSGDICLDILKKDHWSTSQNIKSVIISIISLLNEPNPQDPFNANLAELYRKDYNRYVDYVKQSCNQN